MINLISLGISISALVVSIYAVIYTQIFNKIKLSISNGYFDIGDRGKPDEFYKIWFSINNLSNLPISVLNIGLYDSDKNKLEMLKDNNDEIMDIFASSSLTTEYFVRNTTEKIYVSLTASVDNKLMRNKIFNLSITLQNCQ